jgi:prolyl oligopeptidase
MEMTKRYSTQWIMFVAFCCVEVVFASSDFTLPKTPARNVKDTYFGQTIIDPYRWLEEAESAEVSQWMKAQADYARQQLDQLPLQSELLEHVEAVSGAGTTVTRITRRNNHYFYFKVAPGDNDRKLYVRNGLAGKERLLVDPAIESVDGKRYSLSGYSVSSDGKYVSYLAAPSGAEFGEIRVREVSNGKRTEDVIPQSRAGQGVPGFPATMLSRIPSLGRGTQAFLLPSDLNNSARFYISWELRQVVIRRFSVRVSTRTLPLHRVST